jgi:hypothetical protein
MAVDIEQPDRFGMSLDVTAGEAQEELVRALLRSDLREAEPETAHLRSPVQAEQAPDRHRIEPREPFGSWLAEEEGEHHAQDE